MKKPLPLFMQKIGHKVIAYILNMDEKKAKEVLKGDADLDETQLRIIHEYIDYSRQLRLQGLDQDVDFALRYGLSRAFLGEQHIFTQWHKQTGGIDSELKSDDQVVDALYKLAVAIYPIYLIENDSIHKNFLLSMSFPYHLSGYKKSIKNISDDQSLMKIFPNISQKSIEDFGYSVETLGYYLASNGRGGSIQLSGLPQLILNNAFLLAKLRNDISKESLFTTLQEIVNYLRLLAEGKEIELPIFIGFSSIGFKNFQSLDTELGTIIPYSTNWIELLPNSSVPPIVNPGEYLGFILKNSYTLNAKFSKSFEMRENNSKSVQPLREKIDSLQQKICLVFSLAIDNETPIGSMHNWILYFNPLYLGLDISWRNNINSPVNIYFCEEKYWEPIKYWACKINDKKGDKIRIALDRIVTSLTNLINPESGFIDSVIALDSLFGASNDSNLRISMAVASLLGSSKEERKKLQKDVSDIYDSRSKVLHGKKNLDFNEALKLKNKCLFIAISCLRKMYTERPDLIEYDSAIRSKELLLE